MVPTNDKGAGGEYLRLHITRKSETGNYRFYSGRRGGSGDKKGLAVLLIPRKRLNSRNLAAYFLEFRIRNPAGFVFYVENEAKRAFILDSRPLLCADCPLIINSHW